MMVTCSGLVTSWLGGQPRPRPRLRRRPGWDLEDMEATEAMGDMEAMVWEDLGMALDIAGKKQFIYFGVNIIISSSLSQGMAILLTTLPLMDTAMDMAMVTSTAMVTATVTARGRLIMTWWLRTE